MAIERGIEERGITPSGPRPGSRPIVDEPDEGFGGERIRQVIEKFRARGALSPQTALTADELGSSRIFVRIMKRRRQSPRVFVEVKGKYDLGERALRATK